MKQMNRFLAMLLCFVLVLGCVTPAAGAVQPDSTDAITPTFVDDVSLDGVDNIVELSGGNWTISGLEEEQTIGTGNTLPSDDEIVTVIVVLEEEPLLKQAQKLNLSSDMPVYLASVAGQNAEAELLKSHSTMRRQLQALCGDVEQTGSRDYTAVINGFSMQMPYGMIAQAEALPGVKSVTPVTYYNVPEDMSSYDLAMANSNGMIGADEVFSNASFDGHDGSGAVVAILDTGLDTDHEAFSVMPEVLAYDQADIQAMMNASALSSGITNAADTYVNAKVPYAYDYANDDTDVNGDIDHGVHVAGTVAGNNGVDFFGVAPNAQLMIMKVFADGTGSANSADITAGLDDAVKLGADSINMSLGSPAGFTWNRATEDEVYNNCYDAGINLLIAAGNETSTSYGNQFGNGLAQADSLDNGIVGSPSTGYGAMSVASVQNCAAESDYFLLGGIDSETKVPFNQCLNASNSYLGNIWYQMTDWVSTSMTLEFVVIPGIGAEEDYEGLDVSGKVALIARGQTSFEEKVRIAVSHGAKFAIIYNTPGGGSFYPAYNNWYGGMIGISHAAGQMLIEAAANGSNTVTFGPAKAGDYPWQTPAEEKIPWVAVLPSDDAGQMSSFSNIGPGTDLSLKPEISAPGGNIVSSIIGGGYAAMSGTSMATPHMAGAAAVVRNYVKNELGITDSDELRNISEALMMSTAVPTTNANGVEYSPRQQGAGIVNVQNAVTSGAYLTVDNVDDSNPEDVITVTRPKLELGWNEEGLYEFSFNIHNVSDSDITYTLVNNSLTEDVTTAYGVDFSNGVARKLDENDFGMVYSCGQTVTVPAGETVTVEATMVLSQSYKRQTLESFENGNYVEGFIYLVPNEGVTLTLPYLGYLGDWLDAGLVFEGAPDTNWQLQPTAFASANENGSGYYLGENAYEGTYNYDKLAFSPTLEGGQQYLATILTTRRNLTDFSMTISDENGEVLWGLGTPYLTKAFYYAAYGYVYNTQIITDGWTGRYYNEESGKYDGELVPAGQYYYYTFAGNVGQSEDGYTSVTYPIWLDDSKPEVSNVQTYVDEETGKFMLSFDTVDDHFIRVVNIVDSTNTYLVHYTVQNFSQITEQGSTSRVIMDLDGLCQFLSENGLNPGRVKIIVSDCALNDTSLYVDLGPQYLSLSNMSVAVGASQAMAWRVLPERLTDTIKLTWSSSDESIATIDADGVVTGISYGQVYITATAETGLSAYALVTIGDETLPPVEPETPDPDAHVDYPSAEVTPVVLDNRVSASDSELLSQRFQAADGLWYKITGADTVQLIRNPEAANDYANPYPNVPSDLVIPETVTYEGVDYTVTTIGPKAFFYCGHLTSITMPDTIRVVGDYAFQLGWGTAPLTEIKLSQNLEEVGTFGFAYCKVDFDLPESLRIIGNSAFTFTNITEVSFGDALEYVAPRAFGYCSMLTKAELPAATQNSEGLYMSCTALSEVTIEDGVQIIPENCFYNCTMLTAVELPASVTEIGKSAFQSAGLTDLCLEGSNVTTIGDFAYAGLKNCYDFIFPDSVTYIGSNALYFCFYVRSITFGENVAYIGENTMTSFFIHNDVEAVIPEVKSATAGAAVRRSGFLGQMTRDGAPYDVYTGAPFTVDGIEYMPISDDEVMVVGYDDTIVMGVVTIPETVTCEGDERTYTVTSVGDRVFSSKYHITEIHLPDTITTVGERAFDQVHALEYINIPANLTTLTGIQAFGFGGWNTLEWSGVWNPETLVIPGTLETWNTSAFSGNHYTSIVLSEGLEMVGSYGLYGNSAVTEVSFPSTLKYIKDNAFGSFGSLHEIELNEGLLYIGEKAFVSTPLDSVSLPDSLQYIGSKAFSAISIDYNTPYPYETTYVGVPEVTLPGGVIGLGWDAFEAPVLVTTTLASQRNLVVERCNLDNLPTVCWDGRTDIPAGDWSVIPAGTTVTVSADVAIDGKLYIEEGATLLVDAQITGDGEIVNEGTMTVNRFEDVAAENFFFEGVMWAMEQGITTGTTEVTFSPDKDCTRAEIVTMLWRAAGSPASTGENPFEDVTADDFFYDAVLWAVEQGITNGVDDTHFAPYGFCSRAQAVTFLWRAMEEPAAEGEHPFVDVESGIWYENAVLWAVANGITNGVDDTHFGTALTCNRAHIVTFLYRAYHAE